MSEPTHLQFFNENHTVAAIKLWTGCFRAKVYNLSYDYIKIETSSTPVYPDVTCAQCLVMADMLMEQGHISRNPVSDTITFHGTTNRPRVLLDAYKFFQVPVKYRLVNFPVTKEAFPDADVDGMELYEENNDFIPW